MRTEVNEPQGTMREQVQETVQQIGSLRRDLDAVVDFSDTARHVWDKFRPDLEDIEHDLEQIDIEGQPHVDVRVQIKSLQEQWARLEQPLTDLVDTVHEEERRAQHARHERVVEKIHGARAQSMQSLRDTFDALGQSLHELARPKK